MKRKTRTIKMAEETQKFKSKTNERKNFILDTIRVSSGHRLKIHNWGTDEYGNSCDEVTEFIEFQARNTNKGQAATLYIPLKNIDSLIRALSEVRPPARQLVFGDLIEDSEEESKKLIVKLQLNATDKSAFKKEIV